MASRTNAKARSQNNIKKQESVIANRDSIDILELDHT